MRKATPEQKNAIKEQLIATPLEELYDFDSLGKSRDELVNTIKEQIMTMECFAQQCGTIAS